MKTILYIAALIASLALIWIAYEFHVRTEEQTRHNRAEEVLRATH